MPTFLLHALDKPGALDLRLSTRAAHLEWASGHADKIRMAGPVFADDGETFAGSVFVIEMQSLEAARDWAATDPYAAAGLFGEVSLKPFKWLIGDGPRR